MESPNENCPVCHESVTVYAVGECDHPICYRCSVRMRALCEQMYCPICRRDLTQVYLIAEMKKYADIPRHGFIPNRHFKVFMENNLIKGKVDKLLEHRCPKCKGQGPFRYFRDLETHMRKEHTLFYCSLCVQHLKIFTSERKFYSRADLATHRRVGDKNDSSYKGHPLCQFCDDRYMDNDELYRHLRKDHYFCHFCEADGNQDFYSDYDSLRSHFKKCHHLCQEGECSSPHVQFTHAFRSGIDLKAHVASVHQKGMSKAQVRQARQIDIDINYGPVNQRFSRGERGSGRQDHVRANKQSHRERFSEEEMSRAIQSSLQSFKEDKKSKKKEEAEAASVAVTSSVSMDSEQFPTLSTSMASSQSQPTNGRVSPPETEKSLADRLALSSHRSVQHGRLAEEEFPTLSSNLSGAVSAVSAIPASFGKKHPGANSSSVNARPQSASNVKTTNSQTQPKLSAKVSHHRREEDFPELPSSKSKKNSASANQWKAPTASVQSSAPLPRNTLTDIGLSVTMAPSSASQTSNSHRKQRQSKLSLEDDFPSLSSNNVNAGPSLLNWSKTSKESQVRKKKQTDWFDVGDESEYSMDKLLGDKKFSSIATVSNSANSKSNTNCDSKSAKKKNEKNKKKKETNSTSITGTVTANTSSLDNIASSLLSSGASIANTNKNNSTVNPKQEATKESNTSKRNSQQTLKKTEEESDSDNNNVKKGVDLKPLATENPFSALENIKIETSKSQKQQNSKPKGKPFTEADFPSLSSSASSKKPPPGFNTEPPRSHNPPPGFGKMAPPPGFDAQVPVMNGVNPSKQEEMGTSEPQSSPVENFVYSPTENFQDRNRKLIEDILKLVNSDSDKFNLFKSSSGQFRSGEISAQEYLEKCKSLLQEEGFSKIFPELLVLLPDLEKQQDMFRAFLSMDKASKKSSKKGKGAWLAGAADANQFQVCATCGQVLLEKDFSHHMSLHEPEFPSLNSKSPVGLSGPGFLRDWVRAK